MRGSQKTSAEPRFGLELTRREVIGGALALMAPGLLGGSVDAAQSETKGPNNTDGSMPYSDAVLPAGVRSRFVNNGNGIRMHVLEAGFQPRGRGPVVLLHGYPELAYSWRRVMPGLAAAGYHVIAPDLRGYGRTSGTDVKYDDDLAPFRMLNEVRDILGLVSAFGYRSVAAVFGHDFGSPVAALVRAHPARRVPIGRDDERAVRRLAIVPVQHRRQARGRAVGPSRRRLRRAGRAEPAAQALSAVLRDARGERQHVEGARRGARVPARLLPHEERRLDRQQAASAQPRSAPPNWPSCRATT